MYEDITNAIAKADSLRRYAAAIDSMIAATKGGAPAALAIGDAWVDVSPQDAVMLLNQAATATGAQINDLTAKLDAAAATISKAG